MEEMGMKREREGVGEQAWKREGDMPKEWPAGSLGAALSELKDVRREHLRVHDLVPVLLVSVAAMTRRYPASSRIRSTAGRSDASSKR